ncbi:MAG TPA: site-2 protease family protein, partial [Terriglobia bacterium]|nr:site-2 protease family protein [Terriglobia bacterium]
MDSSFNPVAPYPEEVTPRKFPWLNVVLFLFTCLTTWLVGIFLSLPFYGEDLGSFWNASSILRGLPFSIAIMSILLSHEMGHYLTSRYYGIDASLPYFIPFPNLVGTLGAFIKIRSPFQDRRSLLEVGVMGPIAGFVVAVIALISSMTYARFMTPEPGSIHFMDPLILKVLMYVMGMTPPDGMDVYLHPVSFAAWFGFFLTALNLLPAAQLDGGHI